MGAQFCSLGAGGPDATMSTIRPFELDGFDKREHRRSYSSDELHVLEAAKMVAAARSNCPCEPASRIPQLFEKKEAPLQDAPGTYLAVHRTTGAIRRLTSVRKPRGQAMQEELRSAIRRLQHLRGDGAARILEVFEDHRSLSIVTEQCVGGTVYDRILQRQYFAEQESAVLVRHVLQSVAYLHEAGLSHGHIVPDSFRFQTDQPHASLKLVDYGLELKVQLWESVDASAREAAGGGSPCRAGGAGGGGLSVGQCVQLWETCRIVFCAPEVVRHLHGGVGGRKGAAADAFFARSPGKGSPAAGGPSSLAEGFLGPEPDVDALLIPADTWSVGAIAFLLLCGYPPFYAPCRFAILSRIDKADYAFDPPFWSKISEEAKDFVQQCLRSTPGRRLTMDQALQHPWIQSLADNSPSGSMLSSFTMNLRRFYWTSIIEACAANSLASTLKPGELERLHTRCREADVGQSGFLTATDLRQILIGLGHSETAEALGKCSSKTLRHPGEAYMDYLSLAESARARRVRLVEEELWRAFQEFADGGSDDPAGASSTGRMPAEKLGGFLAAPAVQKLLVDSGVEDSAALASAASQHVAPDWSSVGFDGVAAEVLQRLPPAPASPVAGATR